MGAADEFRLNGYLLRRPLFSRADFAEIQRMMRASGPHEHCLWPKDLAACDANIFNVASHPAITRELKPLLGERIVLWGASCLERSPGEVHPWHTDIESSRPEGGFVTVWIGLEGTSQASSLKLLPGTHLFGKSVQELLHAHGVARDAARDEDLCEWAGQLAGGPCAVVQPPLEDGDAIFFDGRLWHGSVNGNADTPRYCLLFQYAAGDVAVRRPDFSQLTWPFRFYDQPRPSCIAVLGEPDPSVNSLVARPPQLDASLAQLGSGVSTVDCGARVPRGQPMMQQHFLDGRCGNLQRMRSHASILVPGETPHPPHAHVDEELLIVLDGEASLRYDDGSGAIVDHRAGRGDGVYYPAFHRHTIHNPGDASLAYLMFKWIAPRSGTKAPLDLQRFTVPPIASGAPSQSGYSKSNCFAGATHHLKKLQCHVSTLQPGGGYDAHADEHDIALVVLEGRVETLGRTVSAGEFAWYASGEPHGMHNPGPDPARYIVFEFHGEGCTGAYSAYRKPRGSRTLIKGRSPRRIVKNIKRIFARRR